MWCIVGLRFFRGSPTYVLPFRAPSGRIDEHTSFSAPPSACFTYRQEPVSEARRRGVVEKKGKPKIVPIARRYDQRGRGVVGQG